LESIQFSERMKFSGNLMIQSKIELLEKVGLQFTEFVKLVLEYVNIDMEKYLTLFTSQ